MTNHFTTFPRQGQGNTPPPPRRAARDRNSRNTNPNQLQPDKIPDPLDMDNRGGGRGGNSGVSFRGGRGGDRGGARGGRGGHGGAQQQERKPREAILDLAKFMDKAITVKFNGGREVVGILKGYDQLMNLVLDDVKESLRDEDGNEQTRELGLVVARGPMLTLISPIDGSERIENPFMAQEGVI